MIQWLGTPVRGHGQLGQGQVPEEIILSVQAALNRESDLRNSQRVFINSGVLNADMCQSLREWGGNALDLELRTLVSTSSWGPRLQAACAEAGFGPVAQTPRPRPTGTAPTQCGPGQQRVLNADTGRFECISLPAVATGGGGGGAALIAFIAAVLIGGYLVTQS